MYTICIGLVLFASVLLILAVLVQSPKSGMAANFGASNQVMGVRQTSDFLEKFTWAMAIGILVLSLVATMVMGGSHASGNLDKEAGAITSTQTTEQIAGDSETEATTEDATESVAEGATDVTTETPTEEIAPETTPAE